ncbi:hypothetical protein ACIO3O_27715 [Streptomyces sp. NPDC087440]|uniref:hypothetical protein n=1 Tax=Streptomyces sp. NPDC087440 TaxID=3365790 RepID=UPI00380FB0F2
MAEGHVTDGDRAEARRLAAEERHHYTEGSSEMEALAGAVSALRREDATTDELRSCHYELWTQVSHRNGGLLERLAELLVSRGAVPGPYDYDGKWWLWWPKKGRGPCRDCGRVRVLTRYSNSWGQQYRYLCSACRKAEREDISRMAEEGMAQLVDLVSWAEPETALTAAAHHEGEKKTVQTLWQDYADRLVTILQPLADAGWELREEFDSDGQPGHEPLLFAEMWRGRAALPFEYAPEAGRITLHTYESVGDDWPEPISALESWVEIEVPKDKGAEAAARAVARAAGEAGLLDALHVQVVGGAPEDVQTLFAAERFQSLLRPAAEYRGVPLEQVARDIDADSDLQAHVRIMFFLAGRHVEPDVVPSAVALGIALTCWRNETAVEDHHLATDVLMARVNIAVTRAVEPFVCPFEGVDWDGVESALTDEAWALPNGRTVSGLFGAGWSEVTRTVRCQIDYWRRIDTELLGPEAVLRLLTVSGSTSYTSSWWGQGRWRAICTAVVRDAVAAVAVLPQPYDIRGAEALVDSLAEAPDLESDAVLNWFIDLPVEFREGAKRTHGLRHHEVTQPLIRTYEPWWEEQADPL